MSTVSRSDRPPEQMTAIGLRVSSAIREAFSPMDMLDGTEVPAEQMLARWTELFAGLEEELVEGLGLWTVECRIAGGPDNRSFLVTRTLWDLCENLGLAIPTILPPETVACLDAGASYVDVGIRLPDVAGDYDTFVATALRAFASIRKLSRHINAREQEVVKAALAEKAAKAANGNKETP